MVLIFSDQACVGQTIPATSEDNNVNLTEEANVQEECMQGSCEVYLADDTEEESLDDLNGEQGQAIDNLMDDMDDANLDKINLQKSVSDCFVGDRLTHNRDSVNNQQRSGTGNLAYDLEEAIIESLKLWKDQNSHLAEFQRRLNERLSILNLVVRANVPSDGNCFFTCISDQMDRCGMPPKSAAELRQMAVQHLLELVFTFM